VRRTTKRGGRGVELGFQKLLLPLRSEELFSGSESEVVQSLSEFRVLRQRIICKRAERERTQAIIQVPSTDQK